MRIALEGQRWTLDVNEKGGGVLRTPPPSMAPSSELGVRRHFGCASMDWPLTSLLAGPSKYRYGAMMSAGVLMVMGSSPG